MPLYIANPEADRLARRLASRTGETLTDAVIAALRERLERSHEPDVSERVRLALDIASRASASLTERPFLAETLYDEDGLPA